MPSKTVSERVGSGVTAHTRRRRTFDLTKPLSKEEIAELRQYFETLQPRDPIEVARRLAERTLAAINGGDSSPDDFKPYVGMGWYSSEIVTRCDWLEKAKKRGEASERLVELGYEIGVLITEARLKAAWDADVEAALATEEQRRRGGGHNRKRPEAVYVACYEKFREAGLNITDATDEAARELGVSSGTIRRARAGKGASASG